jgi:hypothetical protein
MRKAGVSRWFWVMGGCMFALSLLLFGSWFMQGVGDSDCFYNNPNPVVKASCGKALDDILWKRNVSFGIALTAILVCSVACYRNRQTIQN